MKRCVDTIARRRPRTDGNWPALSCALALLAVLALSGCTRSEEKVQHIQFSFWGSVMQEQTEKELIRAFEQENPDIKVEPLSIGTRYADKIQAMMVGSVAPDVMMIELRQTYEWAERGVLMDLTDEMREIEKTVTLMPVPETVYDRDGKFYVVPINCHGGAMYCNLDALKKAGVPFPYPQVTWEYIEKIAPRLSRKSGNPAAPTEYAMLLPSPVIFFNAFGASHFDDPFHPAKVTINSPQAAEALNFIRGLYARGLAAPPDVVRDQGTYQLFRDGKVAFHFEGRWRTPDFSGKTAFAWDVAPIPRGPVSGAVVHGGTGLAVYAQSRHAEAARRFVRFYASPRGAEISMLGGRYVPVFREVAYGEKFLSLRPPPSIRRWPETMEEGASRVPLYAPGMTEVETIFNSRMEQAFSQPQIPTETILAGLESDLNRWLERMRKAGEMGR